MKPKLIALLVLLILCAGLPAYGIVVFDHSGPVMIA